MDKKKKRMVYRISVLGLLAAMVFYAVYQGAKEGEVTAFTTQGEPAPDFAGETLTEEKLVLSNELEGKTLINFWGTWCEPCKREMPALETAHTQYKEKGFKVISINVGQSNFVTGQFVDQYNLTFPVMIDTDGSIKEAYRVHNLPASFLLDENGVIEQVHEGELTAEMLEGWVN